MNKPELILPAGTIDMLKAAVLNGADAVYLGATKFNARIPAKNFTEEEIKKGIDFAHFYGKKVYMTINILLKDSELKEALLLAKKAYCMGIDAIIVQDLGFMKAVHELLPKLEIHASTQTTCHNVQGAELLADLGVKKIVLARELSLDEIKEVKKAMLKRNVEIECFVHGAMCFSYSGQCVFSSFVFNKSGNRGMCLQPCRLSYVLFEKGKQTKINETNRKFVLSMKDLNTISDIKALIEAGIDSFKVEGRLKGISYVATVARAYRKAIDDAFVKNQKERKLDKNEEKMLKIAFSREATRGYFFNEKEMTSPETPSHKGVLTAKVIGFNQGMLKLELFEPLYQWDRLATIYKEKTEEFQIKKMFNGPHEINKAFPGQFVFIETGNRPYVEMGSDLYMITSRQLADIAFASLKRTTPVKYNLRVFAVAGQELLAVAEFASKKTRINSGFVLAESKTAQTTPELIKEKMFKSSDYFSPQEFSSEIKGNPFIPLSKLKDFKAIIFKKMEEVLFEQNNKEIDEKKFDARLEEMLKSEPVERANTVSFAVFTDKELSLEAAQLLEKNNAFGTIIHYFSSKTALTSAKKQFPSKNFLVKSQNIQTTAQLESFDSATKEENLVASNLGALYVAVSRKKSNKKFVFWVDRELNVFNSLTEKLMLSLGAEKVIPSVECSFNQLEDLASPKNLVPLILFYPLLMTSKAYSRNPEIKQKEYVLVDRKNFEYKARFDEEKLLRLYNPVRVDMLFELERFSSFGMVGIDFSAFEEKEVTDAIEYASEKINGRRAKKKFASFTRGHYEKELD